MKTFIALRCDPLHVMGVVAEDEMDAKLKLLEVNKHMELDDYRIQEICPDANDGHGTTEIYP